MERRIGGKMRVVLLALALLWGYAGAEDFRFVVMGDNRPGSGANPPKVFLEIIEEVNLLDPDFVVLCGDLILGGGNLEETIRQWDEYERAVSRFRMKVWPVPGNHDYRDAISDSLWRARLGRPVYSFDHKGSHFVVLNSEELGNRYKDTISPKQLKWLEEDLRKARDAQHIFVFLHKPLWAFENEQGHWWKEVHPILARYGVRAVFAGHWHQYTRYPDRDGVRYIVTGGAGAPLYKSPGGFHHYLFVTVRGPEVRIAVIRPGNVWDENCVSQAVMDALREFEEGVRVGIPLTGPGKVRKVLKVGGTNVLRDSLRVRIYWHKPGAWKVEPERAELVLGPGERGEMSFEVVGEGARPYPTPKCSLSVWTRGKRMYAAVVGPEVYRNRRVYVPKVGGFRIDGREEKRWNKAGRADGFVLNLGEDLASPQTEVRLAHDGKFLYIFARLEELEMDAIRAEEERHDGSVWKDDCMEVFLQPPGEGYYHIVANSKGVTYECRHAPSGKDLGWDPPLRVAIGHEKKAWTVEMAVPFSALGKVPSPGERWRANFCRERRAGEGGLSCWSCTFGGFHRPERFGELVFE